MKRFLNLAINQAQKSTMTSRHGAVLINNHHAVSSGYNRVDRVFLNKKYQMPSMHAEIDAIRRVLLSPKVDDPQ